MNGHDAAVNPWMILPFGALLAMIALAPLLFSAWWHKHYPKVAFGLAAVTLAYYVFGLRDFTTLGHTAHEYVSFIALVGALFIVSGGIHINVKAEATPFFNVLFLLVGAVTANFLGTTGASMLLIRPWLRMNHHRVRPYHVVFFILLVSNVGGCLTPIGDPPLFLGYLAGIPFWWVAEHCYLIWAVGVGILAAMFLAVDYRAFQHAPKRIRDEAAHSDAQWRFEGLGNLFFLAVILGAVFVDNPVFLREGLMVTAALGSWFTTKKSVHQANHFNFHPIQEVAILFAGIFSTMMPALAWLETNSGTLGGSSSAFYYWSCGTLSGLLDNAPTYICFLKAISARFIDADMVSQVSHLIQTHGADLANVTGPHAEQIRHTWEGLEKYYSSALAAGTVGPDQIQVAGLLGNPEFNGHIVAISIASVFFGAATYIGNGPNFMVKSIADHQRAGAPGFLGYLFRFTLPFLLPMLIVVWWLFFRG